MTQWVKTCCEMPRAWDPFATMLSIQFPPTVPGNQQAMAQVPATSMWETKMEFLHPDYSLAQSQLL